MKKYIYYSIVAFIVMITLSACGSGGDSSGDTTPQISGMKKASSLVATDFIQSNTNITKTDFINRLNSQSTFILNNTTPDTTMGICLNNLLKDKFQISAVTDGTYTAEITEIDITPCYSGSGYTNLHMSIYVDFLDSSSQQYSDIVNAKSRKLMILEGTYNASGYIYTYKGYIAITGYNFNDSCIDTTSPIQCKSLTMTALTSAESNYNNTSTTYLVSNNLSFSDRNNTYYDSGTVDFVINNWSGSMSYTGANSAPTYTANSATESASGTFNYVP